MQGNECAIKASQQYARTLFPDWATNEDVALPYMSVEMGFMEGFKQAAEMSAIEAIELADWLHDNQFVRTVRINAGNMWFSTKILYGSCSEIFSTEQLYTLFKQSNP